MIPNYVYLPTLYQQFIHLSLYARWDEEKQRRETWNETVERYMSFMVKHIKSNLGLALEKEKEEELRQAILNLEVLPSMRALWSAGLALERENAASYNCAYCAINRPRAFDEAFYLLMAGCGVGFSVERQFIKDLPIVSEEFCPTDTTIIVEDSREGWASALKELISLLYAGRIPHWDLSKVRPAGARLKTTGGRASGKGPLDDLFKFTVNLFIESKGTRLTSLQCHDLMCKIASAVIVGGVRKGAMISLSNLSDQRMQRAKTGQWWETSPHRALANNSVCYTETPDPGIFMQEWMNLYESRSGERGIFNRTAAKKKIVSLGRRNPEYEWGSNPCNEVILRDTEFCNLSQITVRPWDTYDDLRRKINLATILGTFQSTLTHFDYLSKSWLQNTEEERLLGVGMTGVLDNPIMAVPSKNLAEILSMLRETAIETNKIWAEKLGIPQSAAITTIKPAGNSSQLTDTASGLHPRHSQFYIRAVRMSKLDPMSCLLKDSGVPYEDDVMSPQYTWVFSFPQKAPQGSITRDHLSAIDHLELWKFYQDYYTEHKPSLTCSIRSKEWLHIAAWVYDHFDEISGISFLPYSDHIYKQAPYQTCTEEEYREAVVKMPQTIDWSRLREYEKDDQTTGATELACTAQNCEV